LELGQFEAVPAAGQVLAWMGADVVKVERPGVGDRMRWIGRGGLAGNSLKFWSHNGRKRSVALDLKAADGRRILLELLPSFDILIENLGPGAMERLGLGWEVLHDVHPALIYGSITGFGPTGPYRDQRAFDHIAQAAGGAIALTGAPSGPPMKASVTFADAGSASNLAVGVLAAYIERERTGLGRRVDVSMQASVAAFLRSPAAERVPGEPLVRGSENVSIFPCSPGRSNDYIVIFLAPGNDELWLALLEGIDRSDLMGDARFESASALRDPELRQEVVKWTRKRTKYEAWQRLSSCGVPSAPVQDSEDLFADPHLIMTKAIQEMGHPEHGPVRFVASPIQFDCQTPTMGPPPMLGAHTLEVLAEAGVDVDCETIRALVSSGLLGVSDGSREQGVQGL
jgi:formyl-CoA transferase